MSVFEKMTWGRMPLWVRALIMFVAYALAAELGNRLSVQDAYSTFWPPAGIALTLLALSPSRDWPVLLVAVVTANISSDLLHGRVLLVSIGFTVANVCEASTGAYLLRRFVGKPPLLTSRGGSVRFGLYAACFAPVVGATIGATVVALAFDGWGASWLRSWVTWWSGDALGILVVGAFALVLSEFGERRARGEVSGLTPPRTVGYAVLLAVTCLAGAAGTAYLGPLMGWKFLVFLPAAVIAALFGTLATTFACLCLAFAMTAALAFGAGPEALASGVFGTEVVVLQGFLVVISFTSLYLAVTVDSSRALAEAQRVLAEKYRVLLEALPSGVTISDEKGSILETNSEARTILGIPSERQRGRDIGGGEWPMLRPDGTPKPQDEWTSVRALREQRIVRGLECMERPDGTRVWLDVTAAPIPVEGYGVAITFNDVTDEVEAQERLRVSEVRLTDLAAHLEELVATRTRELERTNEELREASEIKDRFLHNMSHELRTPLNSIIGFSDVMLHGLAGPLNKEQMTQLGMVHASGQYLLELVSEMLDVARIEAQSVDIEVTEIDVLRLVESVVGPMRALAEQRGLRLLTRLPGQKCMISSDEAKLVQILGNLVENAVKFTKEGFVSLSVDDSDPQYISMSVADTGCGIPESDIAKVAEQFHQVPSADGMKPEGTGLGLTIASRMARLLGGRIDVSSRLGSGSTFTLVIPKGPSTTAWSGPVGGPIGATVEHEKHSHADGRDA